MQLSSLHCGTSYILLSHYYVDILARTLVVKARTATGMDGTLNHCSFENLKPVEISKNCFNII